MTTQLARERWRRRQGIRFRADYYTESGFVERSKEEKKTARREANRKTKLRLLALFESRCSRCGYNEHPAALDFDHINPTSKSLSIAKSLGSRWERLVEEVTTKCIVLCANCHRIKTHDPASL